VIRRRDVDIDLLRRGIDAGHFESVEVGLLGPAVLEGDLAQGGEADAHDYRAFHLRADAVQVDARAAIDGDVDLGDGERPAFADLDLDDRRDIGHEAAMRGDAEPAAR